MTFFSPRLCARILIVFGALTTVAAPSYYGFGFPHIIALEHNAELYTSSYAIVAYDTPIRAKNEGTFLSRFVWQDPAFSQVVTGGVAVGNFWPSTDTREYMMLMRRYGTTLSGEVYRAPGVYSTRGWNKKSSAHFGNATAGGENDIVCIAAGNVLPQFTGAELLVVESLSDDYRADPQHRLRVYSPPATSHDNTWTLRGTVTSLPEPGMEVIGMTAGDFAWAGRAWIAIMYRDGADKIVRYYDLSNFPNYTARGEDITSFHTSADFSLASGDYTREYGREGQAYLTSFVFDNGVYRPMVYSNQFGSTPQALPMIDGWFNYGMRAYSNAPIAVTAGRVFGYLTERYPYHSQYRDPPQGPHRSDPAVAWIERRPIYSKRRNPFDSTWNTHFGWPLPGQAITNTVILKNSGTAATPPGSIRVSAWFNTPYRNADTAPPTMYTPDTQFVVNVSIPTFVTPEPTTYATHAAVAYGTEWPYAFDDHHPTRRLILTTEYWNVVSIENIGAPEADVNERNNRHEMAVHAWTLRPVFYPKTALTNDYRPNVKNDPHSIVYIMHKLGNAIQAMWERSGTSDNEDVKIRVALDGFEIDDKSNVERSWVFNGTNVWDFFEGCRGLDYNPQLDPYGHPYGVWPGHGVWQRFNRDAEGDEGHETTHLFHQLGDIYQYQVFPKDGAGAILGSGRPLQIRTWCANPDVFSSDARMEFCKGTADMHKYTAGMRNAGHENWGLAAPATNFVRVLSRSGTPLEDVVVKSYVFENERTVQKNEDITGDDGKADINWPPQPLSWSGTDSVYGYRKYNGPALGKHIFVTLDLPDYSDGWVWRQDDPHYMHSSSLALPARGFVNWYKDVWDVKTLYEPGAPAYPHDARVVVEARNVRIATDTTPGNVYRVYRRNAPTYIFELVSETSASGTTLNLSPPMGSGQNRAIFYLTEEQGGVESNPRVFQVIATSGARAITPRDNNTLFLTLNAGTADPIMAIAEATEPFAEVATHWFFGHQPIKALPTTQGHALMTISSYSEWGIEPVYVTWIPRNSSFNYGIYNIDHNFAGGWNGSFNSDPQQILTDNGNNFIAKNVNIGDEVGVGNTRVSIVEVISATQLRLASQVVAGGGTAHYSIYRTMGREGTGTHNRNVSRFIRGIGRVYDTAGNPYVGIADMGNSRVLIWDENTTYHAHYSATGFGPTAVDADPHENGVFYAISRRNDKKLYRFTFDGNTIEMSTNWALPSLATDLPNNAVKQCGLAVMTLHNGIRMIAISDTPNNRVLVYHLMTNDVLTLHRTITTALPPAITTALHTPTDVAFLHDTSRGIATLYAVAGGNRIVKIYDDVLTAILPPSVSITTAPVWVDHTVTHYSVAGTNSGQVVGTMWWTNELSGAHGTLPAAPAWRLDAIPLAMGENRIRVHGTNAVGTVAHDSVSLTRMGDDAHMPFVQILTTNTVVPYEISHIAISGTNNLYTVGNLTYHTSVGDTGSLPASSPWSLEDIFIAVGDTHIEVTGTNVYGMPSHDSVTFTRTTYAENTGTVAVEWTTATVPVTSGNGAKIGTDGRYLYYLPGNNNSTAFYRFDPQEDQWTSLAAHPGVPNQHVDILNNGLDYRNGFLFCSLRQGAEHDMCVARYDIVHDRWDVLATNFTITTVYAAECARTLYGNAPAWSSCLVTLTFDDDICAPTPPTLISGSYTAFNCQDAGTQGNWTKRFDAHASSFDDYVYGVKNDWNPAPYNAIDASIGDVVWRAPKNEIISGSPTAVTLLPWNPGAGLCAVTIPHNRAVTRQNEIVVVRGAGIGANQDGWGTATPDIAALSLNDLSWHILTPLPTATGLGTDITEINGELFVKAAQNTTLYRGIRTEPGDTQPPDIDPNALIFPSQDARLTIDVRTNVVWNPLRISDNYDGLDVLLTAIRVRKSSTHEIVQTITNTVYNTEATVTWTPADELLNINDAFVIEFAARDHAFNESSHIFDTHTFYVIPEAGLSAVVLFILLGYIRMRIR